MDDPVHGRRAAIYAIPAKRFPPSFFLGLGIAVALHAGAAYYLLSQRFTAVADQPVIDEGPIVIMDPMRPKVEPEKPKPVTIKVHDPVVTKVTPDTTTPLVPQKTDTTQVDTKSPPSLPLTPSSEGVTSSSVSSDVYIAAKWARFPNADTLSDYYPERAASDEIEGRATVQCTVLDTSGRVNCVSVAESPGGFGFGQATARMVQDKGRVDTSHGDVAVGSMLRQTVVWKLN